MLIVAMDNRTDLELVQQCRDGNLSAFEDLVKRYQRRIFNLSYRLCKDFDAADDIAQETFIKAYQNIESFKVEYLFYTWLYRICMNLSINYLRRQKYIIRQEEPEDFDRLIESQGIQTRDRDRSEEEELLENLREEIELLPLDYKSVLVLKTYENLSCAEIAKILKIPLGTVLSRLSRAREQLARKIKVKKE